MNPVLELVRVNVAIVFEPFSDIVTEGTVISLALFVLVWELAVDNALDPVTLRDLVVAVLRYTAEP